MDNFLLAMDSRALRNYMRDMQPDINLTTAVKDIEGEEFTMDIPFTVNFFWPDSEF